LTACIHTDKMRREQNGALAFDRFKVLNSLNANQAADTFGTGPHKMLRSMRLRRTS